MVNHEAWLQTFWDRGNQQKANDAHRSSEEITDDELEAWLGVYGVLHMNLKHSVPLLTRFLHVLGSKRQ